jgi:hypothetical protein
MFLDDFDLVVSKLKTKKHYFNVFLNEKYF